MLELDQVKRTGTVNGVWSRIKYQNADGTEKEGYIPTSCLDVADAQESTDTSACGSSCSIISLNVRSVFSSTPLATFTIF